MFGYTLIAWLSTRYMSAFALTNVNKHPSVGTSYELTKEELNAFIESKRSIDPSYSPFNAMLPSGRPRNRAPFQLPYYNPHLDVSGLVNTVANCLEHNYRELFNEVSMRLQSARCIEPGYSGAYFVKCKPYKVFATNAGYTRAFPQSRLQEYIHECPKSKVCMPFHLHNYMNEPEFTVDEYKDIQCVAPEALVVKNIEAVAGTSHQQCSASHDVPGGYLPASHAGVNLILTEEVSWANGSAYKAPAMFIVDETSGRSFDRVYELDTDMVSTELTIQAYRGHLQNRMIKFCFEQVSGGRSWTVMLYSWFRILPSHARTPGKEFI